MTAVTISRPDILIEAFFDVFFFTIIFHTRRLIDPPLPSGTSRISEAEYERTRLHLKDLSLPARRNLSHKNLFYSIRRDWKVPAERPKANIIPIIEGCKRRAYFRKALFSSFRRVAGSVRVPPFPPLTHSCLHENKNALDPANGMDGCWFCF